MAWVHCCARAVKKKRKKDIPVVGTIRASLGAGYERESVQVCVCMCVHKHVTALNLIKWKMNRISGAVLDKNFFVYVIIL